jgi:hypothetical protein
MRPRRDTLTTTGIIVGLAAYWIGANVHYARSISPKGISTVRDLFNRFGEPRRIQMVERDGQVFYEFTGQWPSRWVMALPSDPPAYVFDEQGRYVDWCSDPGDAPSYRRIWLLQSTNLFEAGVVRQKFGL